VSLMAYEAERAATILADQGVDAEVIDLRSVRPLDTTLILTSLEKTGRLVVADTTWAFCGIAAEVAAIAAEQGWQYLRAPVRRVTPPDCPAPVSKPLEDTFHPGPTAIAEACLQVMKAPVAASRRLADVHADFQGPY
jgi:acetoin:2,6-dichlorophenolindophenol oxidoreductase subunit beta